MNEFLIGLGGAAGMFVTAFTTWFFTRKKQRTELKSDQQDLESKISEKYDAILDSFDKRLRTALEDIDRATNTIKERNNQIDELTRELRIRDKTIEEFMDTVKKLTDELKKYKQLNGKTESNG